MNSKLLFVIILLFQIFIVINCSCSTPTTTKITNGGSCSSTSQCQTSLLCVSGTCQCPSGSQWFWSSSKNLCAQCPVGWMIYGNHCYFINEISFIKDNAVLWCSIQNATLMIVNDQAEFNFIVNVYNQRYGNGNGLLFIDATRITSNNIVWTDGSSLENSSPWWCSGEPNNKFGAEECVTLRKNLVGPCLHDDLCVLEAYSICERDSY